MSEKRSVGRPQRNARTVKAGLSTEEDRILEAYRKLHGCKTTRDAIRRLVNVSARRSVQAAK